MDFSRISVGIKTFLRDFKLLHAIEGVRKNLPGAQLIIADDGEMTEEKDGVYAELVREGHKVILCEFDVGFGYKSNKIIESLGREFLLVASDDFDFGSADAAMGVKKMLEVLDRNEELDLVSGRVNGRPYEFYLFDEDGVVMEIEPESKYPYRKDTDMYYDVDLTVNYSLIRRKVFKYVQWDDDIKIGGGEHGAFFIDLKRSDFQVGYVPDVNINTQPGKDSERYQSFRRRANSPERPCFERRGIRKYVLGNGVVDYERKD